MTPPPTFKGRVKNGRVIWNDKEGVQRYMSELEDADVMITIARNYGKRTLKQNAYSWVVYEYISQHTGYQTIEVKAEMQRMFLTRPDKRGKMRIRGTSTLNRAEFNEFLERVIWFSATWLGIAVPPPDSIDEKYYVA